MKRSLMSIPFEH